MKVVDEMQQGTNCWKRWVEDEMLGNKSLQEIENLKMATKGLIHYFFFGYLLIYDEMSISYCLVSCENWCYNSENGL